MLGRSLFSAAAAALLLGACAQTQQAAAPPPAGAPAQPVMSNYRVLFASGSSTIQTPETAKIQQAAATFASGTNSTVTVTGHTDTTGSPAFNQALSQRRAAAVTAALVSAGIPAGAITTNAMGETNPPAKTGDQVSDQMNRSVEIAVFQAARMMTDAQYCAMLAPKVRDVSRGADPTGDVGRALANCQNGVGDSGVGFMTKYLADNKVPVPPRS